MKTYPLFKVHIPVDAITNIQDVFESGYINEGIQVTQLTKGLSEVLGAKNLLLLNSCTSALTLALRLCGVEPDDEVISTPMTCVATNTPIVNSGAKLVWADVDPRHGMLTPDTILSKITTKTKVVVVVAWAGTPPDLAGIMNLCEARGIMLVLDAAHAFGANYTQNPIHKFAHFTCYSFQAIKHMTTGDGGALVCRDDSQFNRAKTLKWFGLDRDHAKDEKGDWKGQQWNSDIVEAGYKFNMNNVSAAIGLAQLKHIDGILVAHRLNAMRYDEAFKNSTIVNHAPRPQGSISSFWVYTMLLSEQAHITRDELLVLLNAEGIMAGVVHIPNDDYVAFSASKTDLPGLRCFSERQFSLPCGWWLYPEDICYIAKRVMELAQ